MVRCEMRYKRDVFVCFTRVLNVSDGSQAGVARLNMNDGFRIAVIQITNEIVSDRPTPDLGYCQDFLQQRYKGLQ